MEKDEKHIVRTTYRAKDMAMRCHNCLEMNSDVSACA